MDEGTEAEINAIVKRSRSNLAVTLLCLPPEARRDMKTFYAYCRLVDDIADDAAAPVETRRQGLERWRNVVHGTVESPSPLEHAVMDLKQRRAIPAEEMIGIIDGVSMDLEPRVYETWEDLKVYCYGVASCVGLVSIRIFGCTQAESREYALQLGYGLQLTNIMRDVGQDLRELGRVYLPQEDLRRHGITLEDLRASRHTPAFVSMMQEQAARAKACYAEAIRHRTKADRSKLLAAETMRQIYQRVLEKMEADHFQVFQKRQRVSMPRKVWLLLKAWLSAKFRS